MVLFKEDVIPSSTLIHTLICSVWKKKKENNFSRINADQPGHEYQSNSSHTGQVPEFLDRIEDEALNAVTNQLADINIQ